MTPPCTLTESSITDIDDADTGERLWLVESPKGEQLRITLHDVYQDFSYDLGEDPGLIKDGVESHLQELLAEHITTLGDALGLPDEARELADRSNKEIEEAREAIEELVPDDPMRMAFLYARGNGGVFFIMGEGTGAKDLIEGIGGVDLAAENNLSYAEPANAEALARINPEVIIMMTNGLESTGGIDGLLDRPGVAQTTAGQKKRIVTIPDGQSLAFGPMTGQTLVKLAKAVYDPDNE